MWARFGVAVLLLLGIAVSDAPHAVAQSSAQTPTPGPYWCPMHPNIRGQAGDFCRICRMPLVLAPPPDYAPYHLSVETFPDAPKAGQRTRIHLLVRDPRNDRPVKGFETVHERLLHLFILSQDLQYFAHVHPSQKTDGSFTYEAVFPSPGVYRLIADFLPIGGSPQLVQRTIVTAGYTGSLLPQARLVADLGDKTISGVRIKLSMPPPVAGREQLLTFEFFDAVTDKPIVDLEPYLGAPGHLLVVSADLESVAHSHPVADMSGPFGPTVVFQALFPRAGLYRFWIQIQRHGQVIAVPFTASVRAREPAGG